MSQIEEFKEKAMKDPSLRAELSALAGKSRGELIGGVSAIASRHGYTLTENEIRTAMDRQIESTRPRDLDEKELDQIAAGECYKGYNEDTFGHF
jgi:predicted ribosomally synthesized peptide with nif11-like leader